MNFLKRAWLVTIAKKRPNIAFNSGDQCHFDFCFGWADHQQCSQHCRQKCQKSNWCNRDFTGQS